MPIPMPMLIPLNGGSLSSQELGFTLIEISLYLVYAGVVMHYGYKHDLDIHWILFFAIILPMLLFGFFLI